MPGLDLFVGLAQIGFNLFRVALFFLSVGTGSVYGSITAINKTQ